MAARREQDCSCREAARVEAGSVLEGSSEAHCSSARCLGGSRLAARGRAPTREQPSKSKHTLLLFAGVCSLGCIPLLRDSVCRYLRRPSSSASATHCTVQSGKLKGALYREDPWLAANISWLQPLRLQRNSWHAPEGGRGGFVAVAPQILSLWSIP